MKSRFSGRQKAPDGRLRFQDDLGALRMVAAVEALTDAYVIDENGHVFRDGGKVGDWTICYTEREYRRCYKLTERLRAYEHNSTG